MRLFPQVSPFPTIGSAFVSLILGFVLLSALVLWLDRRFKRISTTRSYEGIFDWGTAGIFLLAGLPTLILFFYGPQASFFRSESVSISATNYFVCLEWSFLLRISLPALWLYWRLKGPGLAWGMIAFLALSFREWFYWQAPMLLGAEGYTHNASAFIKREFASYLGIAATFAQVILLSRYYRRPWLLGVIWLHSQILFFETGHLLAHSSVVGGEGARLVRLVGDILPQSLSLLFLCVAMGIIVSRPKRLSDNTTSNNNSVEWKNVVRSLKRCRPLEDPLGTVRNIFGRWVLLVGGVLLAWTFLAGFVIIMSDGQNEQAEAFVANSIVHSVQMTLIGLVVFALTPSGETRPNAFFVRAFRRDDQTSRLRDLICVALGPTGRLLGIRDPRQRFGVFTRLFAILEGAFRYMGSNRCDLEGADRNWLARVLATLHLRHVDMVIIDLREATEAVTIELKVVVQAMTPLRVIWLVDDSHAPDEWRQKVHQLTLGSVDADAPLNLLNVKEAEASPPSTVIEIVTRVLTESSDPRHSAAWQQALVQAHTLARSHVAEGDWKTPWYETLGGAFCIMAIALAFVVPVMQADEILRIIVMAPLLLAGLFITIRTLISGAKAIGRRRMLRRLGKMLASERGW